MNLTKLDKKIMGLFLMTGVLDPFQPRNQNTIKIISDNLSIRTYFFDGSTGVNNLGGKPSIFINSTQYDNKAWQDYGHALGHLLSLNISKSNLPFNLHKLQNDEINEFPYRFCIPTILLEKLPNISEDAIMEAFKVEHEFARKRIAIHENKFTEVTKNG